MFISVPGGRRKIYEKDGISYIRIYDPETIEKLCEGFEIENEIFFKKTNQEWIETSRDEIKKIEYEGEDVAAILIKARKN
ncbi:MAG: hypothetical protein IH795_11055 [Bacteroidetes bacterium]|nr:hypothetical protein [Bacteroidota bacterium]